MMQYPAIKQNKCVAHSKYMNVCIRLEVDTGILQ